MENNNKHQEKKKLFKILGLSCSIFAAILIITSMILIITQVSGAMDSGGRPSLIGFVFFFIGGIFFTAGSIFLKLGFKKEVFSYTKNEAVPVIDEAIKELSPSLKSLHSDSDNLIICDCGEKNNINNNFCTNCGKQLTNTCSKCGHENMTTSQFCSECGEKLYD